MKRRICLFLLALALCLTACQTEPPAVSSDPTTVPTTEPTQISTLPPETTTPVETTAPEETTEPLALENHRIFEDEFPKIPLEKLLKGVIVHHREPDGEFPFEVHHIRFHQLPPRRENPGEDGLFWYHTDEWEYEGCHYQCYAAENGQLLQVENRSFLKTFSVFGERVTLELDYTIYKDRVYLTYEPVLNGQQCEARVVDTSRGVHECLVEFTVLDVDTENRVVGKSVYFDLVDLETGAMANLLSGFDKEMFHRPLEFVTWTEDGDLILRSGEQYLLFSLSQKTVVNDYPYEQKKAAEEILQFTAVGDNTVQITDTETGTHTLLTVPAEWSDHLETWIPSPNGKRLLNGRRVGSSMHVLIYDRDTDELFEIYRVNTNIGNEIKLYWAGNEKFAVMTEGYMFCSIYQFAQIASEEQAASASQ